MNTTPKYNLNHETIHDLQIIKRELQVTQDTVCGYLYGQRWGATAPEATDLPEDVIQAIREQRDALSRFLHNIGEG